MPSSARKRILVLDDDPTIGSTIRMILTFLGFDGDVAASSTEAVDRYTRALGDGRPFDLVLVDLTLPGELGGEDALNRLRQIDPLVKAIATSGYSYHPVMREPHGHGFCAALEKPFTIDSLKAVLLANLPA